MAKSFGVSGRVSGRHVFSLALAGSLALSSALASKARAEETDAAKAAELNKPPQRRSGIVLSLTLGQGLFASSGFPKDATKVDDPNYYAASGPGLGFSNTLLIMGALSDYVNFGFWAGGSSFDNKHWKAMGGGGGFRVDVFPLYSLVPKARDLGVFGQFGVGYSKLEAKHGASPGAEGAESFISGGLFYDGWFVKMLGGHLSGGPQLEYQAITSSSAEYHGVVLSGRVAFYGGP